MTSQPRSPVGGTATTCLAAGPPEGLCAQAGEVPHEVDTGAAVEARAGAALVHVCGGRARLSPTPSPQRAVPARPARHVAPVQAAGHMHTAEPLSAWHWPPFAHSLTSHGD